MQRTLGTVSFYEQKVQDGELNTAEGVLKLIAKEIEKEGLHESKEHNDEEAP